jgi:uncharacterized membrane protein SpoIIM required for sporulation
MNEKQHQWTEFARKVQHLLKRGRKELRTLTGQQLTTMIDEYQAIISDLVRARSLGAPRSTINYLNRIAVSGHNLLYGQINHTGGAKKGDWFGAFARCTRKYLWAIALSALMFFGPAVVSYCAVLMHSELGYDLIDESFLEFDPAREESLHDIPSISRPFVSSRIVANNIQVTLMAFGLGLTAGIGTTLILIFNGIHLGSIAAWMTLEGKSRALWGWIMPHGGTELMAICIAGGAGYLLASAIVNPGLIRRSAALRRVGGPALCIELGCMAMLVVAGLIEGFISPSSIGFEARIAVLVLTLLIWAAYFVSAGRRDRRTSLELS